MQWVGLCPRLSTTPRRIKSSALRWRFIAPWVAGFLKRSAAKHWRSSCTNAAFRSFAKLDSPVQYRDRVLSVFYQVDFVCYDEILVEVKALRAIGPNEMAQLINYLNVARRSRG